MTIESTLFDPNEYNNKEAALLNILGYPRNEVLPVIQYYRICPLVSIEQVLEPGFDSKELLITDERYESPPSVWLPRPFTHDPKNPIEGFLRGFPLLHLPDGSKVTVMHLHALMDDINYSSVAVPLSDINEIYKYPDEYAQFRSDIDNLNANGSNAAHPSTTSKYQIPLFRYGTTDKMRTRPANAEDINSFINQLDFKPQQVVGEGWLSVNPTRPKLYTT
jgi:hypothetical protein